MTPEETETIKSLIEERATSMVEFRKADCEQLSAQNAYVTAQWKFREIDEKLAVALKEITESIHLRRAASVPMPGTVLEKS